MKQEGYSIYTRDFKKLFSKELDNISSSSINLVNKALLLSWHDYMFSKGVSLVRVTKVSSQFRKILEYIKKDVTEMTLLDLQRIIAHFNAKQRSLATQADYRRVIRQFFKWFKRNDERLYEAEGKERRDIMQFYDFLESDMNASYQRSEINPNDIITEQDIELLIEKGANNAKEKAMLKFLHETGTRAGELLTIKIKNLKIGTERSSVTVKGKTGQRTIPIITSVPYIVKYLDNHPYKDNPDSFLWLSESNHDRNSPIKYTGAKKILERCFRRAGLKKKYNLHWMRHSRATLLAPKLTEVMLCRFMGWTLGSRQVKTYVHSSNEQLEDQYQSMHGLAQEKKQEEMLSKCVCDAVNGAKARYCYKCGRPLNVAVALQDEEVLSKELNNTIQYFMKISQDLELMTEFKEFVKSQKK